MNTINVLGTSAFAQRNGFLLGLDTGLDRQIDLLTSPGNEHGSGWSTPSRLGGQHIGFTSGSSHRSELGTAAYALGGVSKPAGRARVSPFGIWSDVSFSGFNDESGPFRTDGHSAVVYVGADYLMSNYVLIGALVQFDQTEQEFDGFPSRVSSKGWMAGPYATVRFSNHLFLQVRAAWGSSRNEINVNQAFGEFDSDRWLVRGTLLGQWRSGPWQFRPRASVGYIEETQESSAFSLGVVNAEQTGVLGQAKFGPEIAYQYRLRDGTILEPSLLLEGLWSFEQSATGARVDEFAVGPEVRGRAEVGLTMFSANGISFGASLSYDGIGSGDYHAIGGKARFRVPFN